MSSGPREDSEICSCAVNAQAVKHSRASHTTLPPGFANVSVDNHQSTTVSLLVCANWSFCCGKRAVYFPYASPIPFLSLID